MFIDLYEILGISSNATLEDIKFAFKQKAKIYHPDIPETGDEKQFILIKKAFDILSNPSTKKQYDKTGYVQQDKEDLIANAYHVISVSLQEFIKQNNIENRINILDLMVKNCVSKINNFKKMLDTLEKKRMLMVILKRRFRKKKSDGNNQFQSIINELLQSIKEEMAQLQSQIEIYKYVKKILTEYDYVCELELETTLLKEQSTSNIELY